MIRISSLPMISLDLETGGLIPGRHTPLAIGAVILPNGGNLLDMDDDHQITEENSFYLQLEWDTVVVDPIALRINQLDLANPPGPDGDMTSRSLPACEGIIKFNQWLMAYSELPIHAIGMNVGSFDLPMLKSVWRPELLKGFSMPWPFHYRSFDLNSIFFALSQIQNKPFDTVKSEISQISWDKVKQLYLRSSDLLVKRGAVAHHALSDAWSNVYVLQECLNRFDQGSEVLC